MRHHLMSLVAVGSAVALASTAGAGPVLENHRAGPPGPEVRFDPSIAAAPWSAKVLALGYTTSTPRFGASVAISRDAGMTWSRTTALPMPRGVTDAGEATVGFSRGRLVVTYLAFHSRGGPVTTGPFAGGLLAVYSTDLGRHWSRPVNLQGYRGSCGRFPVTPALAGDSGAVAVAWVNEEGTGSCRRAPSLSVAVSHDGGGTWRGRALPYRGSSTNGMPAVAVAGRSVLVAARRECGPYPPTPRGCPEFLDATAHDLLAYYSGDAGRTFRGPTTVAPDFGVDRSSVAIDAAHHTLIAVNAPFDSGVTALGLASEDQVWVSTNANRTWRRMRNPLPAGVGGSAPSVAMSADGSTLVFLAELHTQLRFGAVPVLATSNDLGASWSCVTELATAPTPWSNSYSSRTGLALAARTAHPVWPDAREYPSGPVETLYTTTAELSPSPMDPVCPPIVAGPAGTPGVRGTRASPLGRPES